MDLHRIQFKFFIEDSSALSTDLTVRIFNRWISEATDEVLVDVADYSHVPNGPVTLLVGHQANYSIDNGGGELGLHYAHKQPLAGDLPTRLRRACRATLETCHRLEQDPLLEGKLRFRTGDLLFVANDRLSAPNNAATLAVLQPEIEKLLQEIYGGIGAELTPDANSKQLFSLRSRAAGTPDIAGLLANLTD
jgi:hypothetical protein